eukprot:599975-Pelagomonas_calceolata.AAC.8
MGGGLVGCEKKPPRTCRTARGIPLEGWPFANHLHAGTFQRHVGDMAAAQGFLPVASLGGASGCWCGDDSHQELSCCHSPTHPHLLILMQARRRAEAAEAEMRRAVGLAEQRARAAEKRAADAMEALERAEQRAAAADAELRTAGSATKAEAEKAASAERRAAEAMQAVELVSGGRGVRALGGE